MKTREDMITELINEKIEFWYEWKPCDIADLFRNGLKGYDEITDEELKDEYELHFGED